MRRYISGFLLLSVLFGIGMLIVMIPIVMNNDATHLEMLKVAVLSGALFGGILMIFEGFAEWWLTGDVKGIIGPRQTQHLLISISYNEAFQACMLSLNALRRNSINESNKETGIIKAETFISWKGWGEAICFQINHIDDSSTSITITSNPLLKTIQTDYGKSYQNLENIIKSLKSRSEVQVITPES